MGIVGLRVLKAMVYLNTIYICCDTYIYSEPTAKFRQFMLKNNTRQNTDSCPNIYPHILYNCDHMEAT